MALEKFDFHAAHTLVQAVGSAADALDVKCGQLEKAFGTLHEGFRDSGYDAFMPDLSIANQAVAEVSQQMRAVAQHVAQYAERLRDV